MSVDDEEEYYSTDDSSIAGLVEGEYAYSTGSDYTARLRSRSLDPTARAKSVAWILKVQEYHRFQALTAYLSVNYMDRFLSSHCLPQITNGWPMQLLSVACLSLAAKMEETLAPSLLDLQVEGTTFVFEPRSICKMELLVLSALKWRLRSVTPFTFIDFFACKADPIGTYTRILVSRATKIILSTLHGIEFLDQCPSSIAAASIICAADEIEDLSFIEPGIAEKWCIGLTKGAITDCYGLMREVVMNDVGRKILPQLRVAITLGNMGYGASSQPLNKRRKLCVDDDKEKEGP